MIKIFIVFAAALSAFHFFKVDIFVCIAFVGGMLTEIAIRKSRYDPFQ